MKKINNFLGSIAKLINKMQFYVYGWMPKDKSLHFFAGAMILPIAYKMLSLPMSTAMTLVFVAAVLKELFDENKHRFGLKKGEFDKEDIVYTIAGAACIQTIVGVIHFFKYVI